jgi:predicted O-linked N-acetylglucosamine transferase (SPINDLY family)
MANLSIQQALQLAWQHQAAGQLAQAEQICQQVLNREPRHVEALNLYALVAGAAGRADLAMDLIHRAVAADPSQPGTHINLGVFLAQLGDLDGAIAAYQRATALAPNLFHPHNNLGMTLQLQGRMDEAIASFRAAMRLDPKNSEVHSNLLHAIHFHPEYDAGLIFNEHLQWRTRHADPLKKFIRPLDNDRSPERRLKIGYVSADFREHVVGRFLLPLFSSHERDQFEVICYANMLHPADELTARLRAHASQWRDITPLTDEQAAQLIRQDRIDILVDLGMHTAGNRLLLFARKPAPVQMTYLAYCSTTGLDSIDYRLTDPYLDPGDVDERHYSERSIRLPQTYWCYEPAAATPEVGPLPALAAGQVTFGCLNNFCKVSQPALAAWVALLQAVPRSRLLLHAREGGHRQRVGSVLERAGVDPRRLRFVGFTPPGEYFALYHLVDIALDPFPYCGGTTTCDALWMGVPVVSLRGRTAVGRAGVSVLSNLGMADLVAANVDDYAKIAAALANDPPRLLALRQGLRQRMRQSPLMAAGPYARAVESAYREAWRRYCGFGSLPTTN